MIRGLTTGSMEDSQVAHGTRRHQKDRCSFLQVSERGKGELPFGNRKWEFPGMGAPPNGWFLLGKIPLKWMIWGYPILGNLQIGN